MEQTVRGVGVLDKSFSILSLVGERPRSLGELVEVSGISRATTHRLAVALEQQGLLRREADGRFALGLHLIALGRAAAEQFPLATAARPAMSDLRDATGESVQLYVPDGDARVCVAALESPHGLRTIVPVGAALPMEVGSAGRVLSGESPQGSASGWVQTVGEREPGVASVSRRCVTWPGTSSPRSACRDRSTGRGALRVAATARRSSLRRGRSKRRSSPDPRCACPRARSFVAVAALANSDRNGTGARSARVRAEPTTAVPTVSVDRTVRRVDVEVGRFVDREVAST